MDHRQFDRLTTVLGAEPGRRRAIAGLITGTALLARAASSSARKRKKHKKCKKRCTFCPQRFCCQCRSASDPTTKCILIEAPNDDLTVLVAVDMCTPFCAPDLVESVTIPTPGFALLCGADNACAETDCPITG